MNTVIYQNGGNCVSNFSYHGEKYLCACYAGLTITEKRNRLNEDVAADLIFLRANYDKFEDLTKEDADAKADASSDDVLEI